MAKSTQYLVIIGTILLAIGCSSTKPIVKKDPPNSYTVNGRTYYPLKQVTPGYSQSGIASWYGPGFHGKKTASGEVYNMHELSAAHSTLPLNSIVKVTNMVNKREVMVRVNDRGPFLGDRVIDLSMAAAKELGMVRPGVVPVKVVVIGRADSKVASLVPVPSKRAAQLQTPNPFYTGKSAGLLAFLSNES
jgi:rare lipoprotein A